MIRPLFSEVFSQHPDQANQYQHAEHAAQNDQCLQALSVLAFADVDAAGLIPACVLLACLVQSGWQLDAPMRSCLYHKASVKLLCSTQEINQLGLQNVLVTTSERAASMPKSYQSQSVNMLRAYHGRLDLLHFCLGLNLCLCDCMAWVKLDVLGLCFCLGDSDIFLCREQVRVTCHTAGYGFGIGATVIESPSLGEDKLRRPVWMVRDDSWRGDCSSMADGVLANRIRGTCRDRLQGSGIIDTWYLLVSTVAQLE